jgi:hypothetical protein
MFNIKREAYKLDDGTYVVKVTPPSFVGKGASVTLTEDQFKRMQHWLNGHAMIQHALPELSAEDREILMTGIGPKEWDEMFKEDC